MNQIEQQSPIAHPPKKQPFVLVRIIGLVASVALVAVISFMIVGMPPKDFPVNQVISIPQNTSVSRAGIILERQGVIKSNTLFEFLMSFFFNEKMIIAGDYQFDKKQDILQIIFALTRGTFGKSQVRITFPEGVSVLEMADILAKSLPDFDTTTFVEQAKPLEGFLFPDTYFFFQSATPEQIIAQLKTRSDFQMNLLQEEIKKSGKTQQEIIIMASLLEKEARNADEAKTVSGILWKRIAINMPLQVDAPFLYVLGKTSAQLTRNDLERDGPYNTYTRRGLPVGPIGNPGLDMIRAALDPKDSPYLFYLHDRNGKIYYARNHDEHVRNKQRYLRN